MNLWMGVVSQQYGIYGEVYASAFSYAAHTVVLGLFNSSYASSVATASADAYLFLNASQSASASASASHSPLIILNASSSANSTASASFAGSTAQASYVASWSSANPNANPVTWTSAGIGAADTNRVVVVPFCLDGSKTYSDLSVTIGGVTATVVWWQQPITNEIVGYAYATVATGTTANIVFSTTTGGAKIVDISASTLRFVGFNMTAEDTHQAAGTTVSDTAFSTSTGAAIIGAFMTSTANTSISWTNLTEAQETALNTNDTAEAYSLDVAGGTITVSVSTTGGSGGFGFFASFAPA